MVTPSPTGNREFRNEVVRISEHTINTVTLEGLVFQNCKLLGPAVLVPMGDTSFAHCTFLGPGAKALFWEIPPDRSFVVGAVAVKDCTFSACTFENIGFGGPPQLGAQLDDALSVG